MSLGSLVSDLDGKCQEGEWVTGKEGRWGFPILSIRLSAGEAWIQRTEIPFFSSQSIR